VTADLCTGRALILGESAIGLGDGRAHRSGGRGADLLSHPPNQFPIRVLTSLRTNFERSSCRKQFLMQRQQGHPPAMKVSPSHGTWRCGPPRLCRPPKRGKGNIELCCTSRVFRRRPYCSRIERHVCQPTPLRLPFPPESNESLVHADPDSAGDCASESLMTCDFLHRLSVYFTKNTEVLPYNHSS